MNDPGKGTIDITDWITADKSCLINHDVELGTLQRWSKLWEMEKYQLNDAFSLHLGTKLPIYQLNLPYIQLGP